MSASPDSVLAKLATIQAEISDPVSDSAVRSFENVPYTISVADMPLFVNYVGALTRSEVIGSDDLGRNFNEIRNYIMRLYHSPIGSGIEGEKMGVLTPYFELVYTKFGSYPHLNGLSGILDAKLVSDTGMTVMSFAGQNYFGINFTLQVTGKTRRLLADSE